MEGKGWHPWAVLSPLLSCLAYKYTCLLGKGKESRDSEAGCCCSHERRRRGRGPGRGVAGAVTTWARPWAHGRGLPAHLGLVPLSGLGEGGTDRA